MRYILFVLLIFDVPLLSASSILQEDNIIITDANLLKNQCIAHQSFASIGPSERKFYSHEIVYGYKYGEGQCNAAHANATLYKKTDSGYQQIIDYGGADPAVRVFYQIVKTNQYLILISDYNDGGNAGYPHQQAYVIDDANKIHGINIQSVQKWVNTEILKTQHVVSVESGINYLSSPISFAVSVFNKGDHYRHPSGGVLKAKLELVKENGQYAIKIIDRFSSKDAQKFNKKGMKLYQKKDYQAALHWFKKSCTVGPDNRMACNNQALALYKLKEYKSSIDVSLSIYNNNNASHKEKGNASFNIAMCQERLGDMENSLVYLKSAQKWYETAHKIEPKKARNKAILAIKEKIKNRSHKHNK